MGKLANCFRDTAIPICIVKWLMTSNGPPTYSLEGCGNYYVLIDGSASMDQCEPVFRNTRALSESNVSMKDWQNCLPQDSVNIEKINIHI